jgi:hypothetical protein
MKRRLITTLVSVCIAAVPVVVLPTHPAQAAGLRIQCTGSASIDFVPGLTNTPRTVDVFYNSTLSCPIAPLNISGGSGSGFFTVSGATCTNLTFSAHTVTYNWRPNLARSIVNFSTTSVNVAILATLLQTGSVSSGEGVGDQVADNVTLVNLNLTACNTSAGLQSMSGPEVLSFVTP